MAMQNNVLTTWGRHSLTTASLGMQVLYNSPFSNKKKARIPRTPSSLTYTHSHTQMICFLSMSLIRVMERPVSEGDSDILGFLKPEASYVYVRDMKFVHLSVQLLIKGNTVIKTMAIVKVKS